jgi:hypothetical protein
MKNFKQYLIEARTKFHKRREQAAADIHSEWMRRNPKGDWNAAQHVPYEELPREEQLKDLEHLDTIAKLAKEVQISDPANTREAIANAFGSIQHEKWRKGFDPEGTGKERQKSVSGGGTVNINVGWEDLHPEWKKENLSAGFAAYDAYKKNLGQLP